MDKKSKQTIKGYKVFLPDFTAKEKGFKYAENKIFEESLPIQICSHGLHFCIKAVDCFSYYSFDPNNIVCEVEALGETQTHDDDSKVCTNILKVGRRLTWPEVLEVANSGSNNTGHSNSGYRNSGDRNSGYRNSGDWNSGDRNSGNWNSGNWNSGDRNSGDSNSGYRNSGAFCTDDDPELYLFDKPTGIKVKDWERHEACQIMTDLLDFTIWVSSSKMTEEEKKKFPKHETTEGYLKTKTVHEAWADMWGNLSDRKKKVFTSLPNFDADKFKKITGITV